MKIFKTVLLGATLALSSSPLLAQDQQSPISCQGRSIASDSQKLISMTAKELTETIVRLVKTEGIDEATTKLNESGLLIDSSGFGDTTINFLRDGHFTDKLETALRGSVVLIMIGGNVINGQKESIYFNTKDGETLRASYQAFPRMHFELHFDKKKSSYNVKGLYNIRKSLTIEDANPEDVLNFTKFRKKHWGNNKLLSEQEVRGLLNDLLAAKDSYKLSDDQIEHIQNALEQGFSISR